MSTTTVVVVVILIMAAILAEPSSGFKWVKGPGPIVSMTYPDQKSITLRWEWKLGNTDDLSWAEIDRYKTLDKNNTIQNIATCYTYTSSKPIIWNRFSNNKFSCQAGKAGVSNGYFEMTISDVTERNYGDAHDFSVMAFNYSYECKMSIYPGRNPTPKTTKLVVYMRPTIKTTQKNKYVDRLYKDVTFYCTAEGNPKPTIIWEHKHPSGVARTFKGEELIISKAYADPFQLSDVGLYTCKATNTVGNASTSAVVQYTKCGSGCSTDDTISIEMTELVYTSDYDYSYSAQYHKLKHAVEVYCFSLYFKAAHKIMSCVVTGFRKGSVIVDLTITYPSDPRKPLQTAISTGMFAGQRVKTSFVPRKDSSSISMSTVIVIVLGVFLSLSLVGNLIFTIYFIRKRSIERKERHARSLNNNESIYQRSDVGNLPPMNVTHYDNAIYHCTGAPFVLQTQETPQNGTESVPTLAGVENSGVE